MKIYSVSAKAWQKHGKIARLETVIIKQYNFSLNPGFLFGIQSHGEFIMSSENELKEKLLALLDIPDFESLVAAGMARHAVVRSLIGLTYDLSDVRSWRAIEAIGLITARMPADRVRNLLQRLLWMLREESGNNAWTAGQIVGEIISRNPAPFEDIAPIVISFHDEPVFRVGALWSMYRIGSVRHDLSEPFAGVANEHLTDPDPRVRGLSVLALSVLGPEHSALIGRMRDDAGAFYIYREASLHPTTVGDLARAALSSA